MVLYNKKTGVENMLEEKVQKQTKFEKLTMIAKNTKESLIRNWKENDGCFVDKDKMTKPGIMAEVSGLTSLLLFLIAFNEEKDIVNENDRELIREIHRVSFSKICSWVKEDGFTAEPSVPIGESKRIFKKNDSLGYVDSITWALSVAILTRYLERKQILTMDIELLEKNYDLLTEALGAVISSQRDDGTWGFLSDKKSEKSLYFTFVCNAAIADFFDYIMGEIAYISISENATEKEIMDAVEEAKDEEILRHLGNKFREKSIELVDDSVEKTMEEVRRKIQDWLIFDCLPLMPELAICEGMAANKKERLGVWPDPAARNYEKYFNLYYIYYLIEMMVTSGSDQRMKEIIGENGENEEGISNLKKYYEDNELMASQDIRYYFSNENIPSLWKNIMEQSIHSSRTEYMNVSRTGKNFWDSADGDKSSLKIRWNHPDHRIQDEVESIQNYVDNCTDPCIIPMALRSNIMYSYYISEQSDMTVDRLFNNICDQIADTDTEKLFEGLWDSIKFSLTVTERSVEALVDYYDFLKKFDRSSGGKVTVSAQRSPIDILIEEKIADYLKTPEAKSVIEEYVSARLGEASDVSDAKHSETSFADDFEKYLKTEKGEAAVKKAVGVSNINEMYNKIDELSNNGADVASVIDILDVIIGATSIDEVLASRLIEVGETIKKALLRKQIIDVLKSDDGVGSKAPEKVQDEITKDVKDLYEYVIELYSSLDVDAKTRKSLKDIMRDLYL